MANRVTQSDLVEACNKANYYLTLSGSNYYLQLGHRNGYTALDLYCILPNGEDSCMRNLEGGTTRECLAAVYKAQSDNHGYTFPQEKLTRAQVKKLMHLNLDVSFTEDFHALSSSVVEYLATMAKDTGYRKPKNANGSLARYFYQHLQSRVKI